MRQQVKLVKVRARDVEVGDVVSFTPNGTHRWFEVAEIIERSNGRLDFYRAEDDRNKMGYAQCAPVAVMDAQLPQPVLAALHEAK